MSANKTKREPLKEEKIFVFIAAYNEERHIARTINSIFNSSVADKIAKVIVGDDGSRDNTLSILRELKNQYSNLELVLFSRLGKPNIINELIELYSPKEEKVLFAFVDANITVDIHCLEKLINDLYQTDVGMVGASVIPLNKDSHVEGQYILRENRIKTQESRVTGYVIGVFGACYIMRSEFYRPVPRNFITDDLYQTMSVIKQKKYVLYSEEAKVFENISSEVRNEFRRKSRYAAGNFQILFHFLSLLNPFNSSWGFIYCYGFHKIIRWASPVVFFGCWVVAFFNLFGQYSNLLILGGIGVCLFLCFNFLLTKFKITPIGYRIYYFLSMNLAILYGFFNYIKGIKSNVWERSDRI